MGVDKASLLLPAASGDSAISLAERTAGLLRQVCAVSIEVGPGHTTLPAVTEDDPGAGPLVALAAGGRALRAEGWDGPVLVVATDLPLLTVSFLRWLAGHPAAGSVVPVAGGRAQPLCARYTSGDMTLAARLAAGGARTMNALIEAAHPVLADEAEWAGAGGPGLLADVDTPEDVARLPAAGPDR